VLFDKAFPDRSFNADDPKDIDWLYATALARANSFNIAGVTRQLAKGVVKRIIPAVASTNALIAAVLVNEAFKIATYSNPVMNNYLMYMGQTGVNTQTIAYEKKDTCLVCGLDSGVAISIASSSSLQELLDRFAEHPELRLKEPSIVSQKTGAVIFMQKPLTLRQRLEGNLLKSLVELRMGSKLIVTDPVLRSPIAIHLQLE
jgi:ubiquitin-activating enzyme E1 C